MSRDYVDSYALLATIGLGLLVAGIGYVGWWYGHEQGTARSAAGETLPGWVKASTMAAPAAAWSMARCSRD